MSPRRVLAEHSSRDLSDWQAFERVYGLWTPLEDDLRAGQVIAAVWNASGGLPQEGSEHGRPARPSDFFPRLAVDEDPEPTTHDAADEGDEPEFEDPVQSDVERKTEALKNMWVQFGLAHNAAVRKAREQGPPDNPEAN